MPKVSIIVPVYKAEKFLRQCVDSILAQTFTDWECILVDDGSPDACGAICDEYAQKDARIKVIHKENGGVSSARNVALDRISGKWLTFVDSDDCLYPNALEVMVGYAERDNCDIIQCSLNRTYLEGQRKGGKTPVVEPLNYAKSGRMTYCIGGSLFKSSIIINNNIRFVEKIKLGEDQIFIFNYLEKCKKAKKIDDVLYYYRDNINSAVNNPKIEYWFDTLEAFKELKRTNIIASWQCDDMFLDVFVRLIRDYDIKISEIVLIFSEIKIEHIKPTKSYKYKLVYMFYHKSIILTIFLLRLLKVMKIFNKK